jgi:tetratricopeptide (TPR) repeat protein
MTDHQRIEELRRRVQSDPASIAFAQLAEECRRAGRLAEAVEVCRAGLAIHPGYLSARVTLGRALAGLGDVDAAAREFEAVLAGAPGNLSAARGLADIHHRRGSLEQAVLHYRTALRLAPNDPDLAALVNDLSSELSRQAAAAAQQARDHDRAADRERDQALRTVAALEEWLAAIHGARPDRRA